MGWAHPALIFEVEFTDEEVSQMHGAVMIAHGQQSDALACEGSANEALPVMPADLTLGIDLNRCTAFGVLR